MACFTTTAKTAVEKIRKAFNRIASVIFRSCSILSDLRASRISDLIKLAIRKRRRLCTTSRGVIGGITGTFTFTYPDASNFGYAGFLLQNSAGTDYCYGDWGVSNGVDEMDLYDSGTGITQGLNVSQSDGFCTISLNSVTNVAPNTILATVNITINPAYTGTYEVMALIVSNSNVAGSWQNVGSLVVNSPTPVSPAPTVTLTDTTQSSGYYFAGDSFTLTVTGPPNQPVSVTANGVYDGQLILNGSLAVTNASGVWSTSGSWSASNIGSYTQTWYVGGAPSAPAGSGIPGPLVFQVGGQVPVTSSPAPQPVPGSAPSPVLFPVASGSVTNCNDISGIWTDTPDDQITYTWSLFQVGTTIDPSQSRLTTAYPGGGTTWVVSGQSVGGAATLVASSPSPAFDIYGTEAANPLNVTMTANGCMAGAAQETATFPTYFINGYGNYTPPPASRNTVWARASSPPGLTMTVNLLADQVSLSLTGQNKTGALNVVISAPANSPSTTSLASVSDATPLLIPTYSLMRTSLAPGQYTSVNATWDDIILTVPVSFYVIGSTRFTQYNTPYSSSCTGVSQTAHIYYKMDANWCYWEDIPLASAFVSTVAGAGNGTGTGIAKINGVNQVVKSYNAGAKNVCPLPVGAAPNGTDTFFAVDSGGNTIRTVTGANNTVLSDATGAPSTFNANNPQTGSVAVPVSTTASQPVFPFSFGDQILLVGQNDVNDPLGQRSAVDLCNHCGVGTYASPNVYHIDMYSSSPACSGVTDYVTGAPITAIRLR